MKIITIKMPDEVHKAIIAARPRHGNKAFIEVVRDYLRLGLTLDENPNLKMIVQDNEVRDEQGNPSQQELTWE